MAGIYEQMVSEDGGTGTTESPYYDYDESSSTDEAVNSDFGNESLAYTGGYNDNDDFNPTASNEETNEAGNKQDDDFGGEEAWNDRSGNNRQNGNDNDEEQDVDNKQADNTGETKKTKGNKNKDNAEGEKEASGDGKDDKKKKRKPKRDPYVGVINWHPGDPIDLEFLAKTWGSVSQIKEIKPFVDVANESVDQALKSTGPNLTLRLHRYVSRLVDNSVDTIGSLLKLLQSSGKKMLYLTISSVKAIFDQQWMETTLIAGLTTALKAALSIPFISKVLNAIFAVGVPFINNKFSKATA